MYPKNQGGRPLKVKSRAELQQKIDKYFEEIKGSDRPPTMTGLAISIGVDRKTLSEYQKSDAYGDIVTDARDKIQLWLEEELQSRGGNVTGLIFSLKNNFGFEDTKKLDTKLEGGLSVTINRNVKD